MNCSVRPTSPLEASRVSDNRGNLVEAAFDTDCLTHGLATQALLLQIREVEAPQLSSRRRSSPRSEMTAAQRRSATGATPGGALYAPARGQRAQRPRLSRRPLRADLGRSGMTLRAGEACCLGPLSRRSDPGFLDDQPLTLVYLSDHDVHIDIRAVMKGISSCGGDKESRTTS